MDESDLRNPLEPPRSIFDPVQPAPSIFERIFVRIVRGMVAVVAGVVGFVVSVIASAFFLPGTISAEVGVILLIILGVPGGWIAAKLALRVIGPDVVPDPPAESARR